MSSSDDDWAEDCDATPTLEDADEVSRLKSVVYKFLGKDAEDTVKAKRDFVDPNGNVQVQETEEREKVRSPRELLSHEKEKSAPLRVEVLKAKLKKSEDVSEVGDETKTRVWVNGSLKNNTDVEILRGEVKELFLNNETQKNDLKQLLVRFEQERERSSQIKKEHQFVLDNIQTLNEKQQTLIQINISQTEKIENLSETIITLQKQVKMYLDENETTKEKLFEKVDLDNQEIKDKLNVLEELINAQMVLNKKEVAVENTEANVDKSKMQENVLSSVSPIGTSVKFSVTHGNDTIMQSGVSHFVSTRRQCINLMKEYENKSMEELRHEDYLYGRNGSGTGTIQPQEVRGILEGYHKLTATKEQELEKWRKDVDEKIDKLEKLKIKNVELQKVGKSFRKKLTQAQADHTKEKMSYEGKIDSLKEVKKNFEEKDEMKAENEDVQEKLENGGTGDYSEYINLKVVGPDSNEIHFRMKRTEEMGKLKKSISERVGVPITSLNFFFDEMRINDYETPEDLQMEQNDVIEVFTNPANQGEA